MRAPRPRVSAAVVVLAGLLSACAQAGPPAAVVPAAAVATDPGAAAREAALARVADGAPVVARVTPDIVGRSPVRARQLLAEEGLDMHLVAHDRTRPVTTQHPPAGQPVPLDGVIEAHLGAPATPEPAPEPVDVAAAPPPDAAPAAEGMATDAPAPVATDVAATGSSTDPAAEQVAAADVATRYVLPPHTDGLLRTNPRRLPALPVGTELTGAASWYGPGFHGNTTACGTVYDQNAATIATRELRCGTVVRITGPTGLTVQATVTDWGPAEWTGRRFDLSAAVFNAIAPLGAGVVPVRVVTASAPG